MLLLTELQKETLLPRYEILELVGEGPCSEIYRGKGREGGASVAIKVVDKRLIVRRNMVRCVLAEKEAMLRLAGCSNVIRLLETLQDEDSLYFISEYAAHCDLCSYLREHDVGEELARKMVSGISAGLKCIHQHSLAHRYADVAFPRDIKPENILLDENLDPLISDFGCVYDFESEASELSYVGTPAYQSPDAIEGRATRDNLTDEDWWAFGCTVYFIFAKTHLFHAKTEYLTFQKVLSLKEINFPPNMPQWAKDIVQAALLEKNYAKLKGLLENV